MKSQMEQQGVEPLRAAVVIVNRSHITSPLIAIFWGGRSINRAMILQL